MSAEPDDSICPICRTSTYVGETISCETCMYWFHFECVGVTHDDPCVINENEPYYCPKCTTKGSGKKTNSRQTPKATPVGQKRAAGKKVPASVATPPATKRPRKSQAKAETPVSTSKRKPVAKRGQTQKESLVEKGSSSHSTPPPIKLKISLGSPTKAAKASLLKSTGEKASAPKTVAAAVAAAKGSGDSEDDSDVDIESVKDEEESGDSDRDEEEKWLDAVESGNVENHVDSELRSIQDPKLMTARQRALKANTSAGIDISGHPPLTDPPLTAVVDHISLDFTSAGRKSSTPIDRVELMRQKAIKAQKRKEIENEKREESKKKTVDKLLTTKSTLPNSGSPSNQEGLPTIASSGTQQSEPQSKPSSNLKPAQPVITYRVTSTDRQLLYPRGVDYPLAAQKTVPKPAVVLCSICNVQPKKYSCSKTRKPLCSLACYKANQGLNANMIQAQPAPIQSAAA